MALTATLIIKLSEGGGIMAIQEANGMRLSHSAQEVDDTIDAVDAIDAKIGGDYSSTSTVASAIADAKKAGTDASSALATYKTSNDAAVANAKKAGTDASAHADALNTAIDKRVTALEGKEDKNTTYTFSDDKATDSAGNAQPVTVTKVNGHTVLSDVPEGVEGLSKPLKDPVDGSVMLYVTPSDSMVSDTGWIAQDGYPYKSIRKVTTDFKDYGNLETSDSTGTGVNLIILSSNPYKDGADDTGMPYKYRVYVDGKEYDDYTIESRELKVGYMALGYGNFSLLGESDNTGEPWWVGLIWGVGSVFVTDKAGTHSLSIHITYNRNSIVKMSTDFYDQYDDTEIKKNLLSKADSATTLSGYGITDAYTKTETYTKEEVDAALEDKANHKYNQNVNVLGVTKTTEQIGDEQAVFKKGGIFGGTAAEAGLVTRGICGITSPDENGRCTKENLYINYDGNSSYSRKLILGAESTGSAISATTAKDSYGMGHMYSAVRGDQMVNYVRTYVDNAIKAITDGNEVSY